VFLRDLRGICREETDNEGNASQRRKNTFEFNLSQIYLYL